MYFPEAQPIWWWNSYWLISLNMKIWFTDSTVSAVFSPSTLNQRLEQSTTMLEVTVAYWLVNLAQFSSFERHFGSNDEHGTGKPLQNRSSLTPNWPDRVAQNKSQFMQSLIPALKSLRGNKNERGKWCSVWWTSTKQWRCLNICEAKTSFKAVYYAINRFRSGVVVVVMKK